MTNTVTHTVTKTTLSGAKVVTGHVVVAEPRYIPTDSKMYHNIVAAHGQLISFGMDFSDKLLSHHSSWFVAIPYLILVVGAVGLQYLQMARLNARNPQASQANPQAAMLQKYMPLIFGFIYLNVAAILNVYFIVSSAIRILTQEILFRRGIVGGPPPAPVAGTKSGGPTLPAADRSERPLPKPKSSGGGATGKGGPRTNGTSGSNGKARRPKPATDAPIEAAASEKRRAPNGTPEKRRTSPGTPQNRRPPSGDGSGPARRRPTATNGTRSGATSPKGSANGANGATPAESDDSSSTRPKEHPRSKAKRERKAR
jgi:hypothetical protein